MKLSEALELYAEWWGTPYLLTELDSVAFFLQEGGTVDDWRLASNRMWRVTDITEAFHSNEDRATLILLEAKLAKDEEHAKEMEIFPAITEKRYTQYPRRYLVEYHVTQRTKFPDAKGSCATLASAKAHAVKNIALGYIAIARIFDRMTGQYIATYKKDAHGISIQDSYVR